MSQKLFCVMSCVTNRVNNEDGCFFRDWPVASSPSGHQMAPMSLLSRVWSKECWGVRSLIVTEKKRFAFPL